MTADRITNAISYYQKNFDKLFEEFLHLVKIPSVSTDNEKKNDIRNAANFLVEKLKGIGFQKVEAFQTPLHPIIYGEFSVDEDKPTLLLYGHYDVQPPDPVSEWVTPPFDPDLRGDHLYARGASDMKGQIWALISALESVIKTSDLTLNIKFLIEGEEEIGSPSLDAFLEDQKSLLACDLVLNTDASMIDPDKPTIIYALRGMAYFELRVFGPQADLHSGSFGGVVANPANVLAKLIAGMHDDQLRITLPGFYDKVRAISPEERALLARLGIDGAFYQNISGVPAVSGEADFFPIERVSARPTLDVNGLYSGYTEPGAKTIIPSYAMAKISTRLVPDQDPNEVHHSLKAYLEEHAPDSVRWELDFLSGAPAYITEESVPGMDLFLESLRKTWNAEPLMKREGGSIPVATSMKNILGVDSILTGFGLPDDQIHAPNERLHIPTHRKGVEALIRFFLSF
jgi:acetylornithine deacetylase/succinyl-diaminopimelate desuccinylase-like protein